MVSTVPPKSSNTNSIWLTPAQVAQRFHVSPITVRNWANTGKLEAITTPGGHRRFNLAAVEDFAAQHRSSNHADADAGLAQSTVEQAAVLVIDNDQSVRDILAAVLKLQLPHATVLFAKNAFEAGYLSGDQKPQLIFLDMALTGINTDVICRFIKAQKPLLTTTVITMTGHASVPDRQQVLDAGAMSVLRKPFDLSELDTTIKKSLI